jgi:nitroreductase
MATSRVIQHRRRNRRQNQVSLSGDAFRALARKTFYRKGLEAGDVPAAAFERILEAARWTPSVANRQPWLLAGCRGESARDVLNYVARHPDNWRDFYSAEPSGVTQDVHNADAVVLLMGQRANPFWRECCLLANYQILLATAAEGLASRALMPTSPNEQSEHFKVPEQYQLYSLTIVGLPGEASADTSLLKPECEVMVPLKIQTKFKLDPV